MNVFLICASIIGVVGGIFWLTIIWLGKRSELQPGDFLIYRVPEYSNRPGPAAQDVYPSPKGESYYYVVRKLLTVVRVVGDEMVEVTTPAGEHRMLSLKDPMLHKAGFIERLNIRLHLDDRLIRSEVGSSA